MYTVDKYHIIKTAKFYCRYADGAFGFKVGKQNIVIEKNNPDFVVVQYNGNFVLQERLFR